MIMWAQHWEWVVAANVLLGINQGFAWSMTVIMKIDLVGPKSRGPAVGLNEFAGHLAVGTVRSAAGADLFGRCLAILGIALSILLVRDTRGHVHLEIKSSQQGTSSRGFWDIFTLTSFRDRNLFAASQAGLVNNLNDGMSWGIFIFCRIRPRR